ncbi:transglycosylase domain-containing protein [Kribbella shirazensis]|uniref:Membrane peptidoglycan carboxypeptidase n=1 Tax=Kribbella shirazensis TaxID=1105143 RepID=A0A7X5ZYV9_9ACTN|nr:membrane peptidoglycan carboxypeptidase [Kribbella shirazensis]
MSEARRKAAPPPRRKKHWALRILGWLAALFFLGVIAGVAAFFIIYQSTEIPDPNAEFKTNTTTVTWNNGSRQLGTFFDQNRRSVPMSQIPKHVQDAVIAAEDRSYWTNPGISPSGMVRAAWNIARGEQLQGGSTITQQYVKVMYLTQERTVSRKFKELFIATKLGRQEDKTKTLEGYLNTIYFGEGAYGISAAGEAYFNVSDPRKLSVPQAALLATVLNNPTLFDVNDTDPRTKKRIVERYKYVLDGMRQNGTITEAQEARYAKSLPDLSKQKKKSDRFKGPTGFLLDMARKELRARGFDEDEISGGGLKVVTTFDYKQQEKIVEAAQNELPEKRDNLHVGMASVKPGTGELVAMYGGPDYLKSQLNWATTKSRPGSSFKPFALAAALEDGKSIWDKFQGDSPIEIQGQKLNNEFNRDYGDVTLLKATEQSINTAFYDLVDNQMEDGPNKLVNVAEAAGIPKTKALEVGRNNPSTVLGPDPYASAVDMAQAYATFAAEGKYAPLHTIKEVRGPDGKVLFSAERDLKKQVKQAIPVETARMVNYVLQDVVTKGTGTGAKKLDRAVAGKTGTAGGVAVEDRAENKACDGCKEGSATLTSWWTGYTPELSTSVVYRAGKTGESDLDNYSDEKAFFGGSWPLKTWLAFMSKALEGVPESEFVEPNEDDIAKGSPTPKYTPSNTPPPNTPTNTPPPNTPPPNTPTSTPPSTKPTSSPTKTKPTRTTTTPVIPSLPTGQPEPTETPRSPGGQ